MTHKARAVIALILIVSLCALCLWLGSEEFIKYTSFGNVIIVPWLSGIFIALPIVMVFPFIYFLIVTLRTEELAFNIMNRHIRTFKLTCVLLIIACVTFPLMYKNNLQKRGYIACKGVPSGWMPGMATKYVINEQLCQQ
jgi:hypothetical protein